LILLPQNKFVKTHHHHSLCIRNGEGANRGFYEGLFKTLNIYSFSGNIFKLLFLYSLFAGVIMKKENCPFCAHRWIRSSLESPVTCPNCHKKYYIEIAEKNKNVINKIKK